MTSIRLRDQFVKNLSRVIETIRTIPTCPAISLSRFRWPLFSYIFSVKLDCWHIFEAAESKTTCYYRLGWNFGLCDVRSCTPFLEAGWWLFEVSHIILVQPMSSHVSSTSLVDVPLFLRQSRNYLFAQKIKEQTSVILFCELISFGHCKME